MQPYKFSRLNIRVAAADSSLGCTFFYCIGAANSTIGVSCTTTSCNISHMYATSTEASTVLTGLSERPCGVSQGWIRAMSTAQATEIMSEADSHSAGGLICIEADMAAAGVITPQRIR